MNFIILNTLKPKPVYNYKRWKHSHRSAFGHLLGREAALTTAGENSVCYWFSNTEKYFWFFWTIKQRFIIFICYYKGKKSISVFKERWSLWEAQNENRMLSYSQFKHRSAPKVTLAETFLELTTHSIERTKNLIKWGYCFKIRPPKPLHINLGTYWGVGYKTSN